MGNSREIQKPPQVKFPAKGFTFTIGGDDVFVVTSRKYKTRQMVEEVIREMHLYPDPTSIHVLTNKMRPGILDKKKLSNGREYYDIHGQNFGGHGFFLDEGKTWIIKLAE